MIFNYFHMVGWWLLAISMRKETTDKRGLIDGTKNAALKLYIRVPQFKLKGHSQVKALNKQS